MDSEVSCAYQVADWLFATFPNVVEHFELTVGGSVRRHKELFEDGEGTGRMLTTG